MSNKLVKQGEMTRQFKNLNSMMKRLNDIFDDISSTDMIFSPGFYDFYDRRNDLINRADDLFNDANDLFKELGYGEDELKVAVDYNRNKDNKPKIEVTKDSLIVTVTSKDGNSTHTVTTTIPEGYNNEELATKVDKDKNKFIVTIPKEKKCFKKKTVKTNPFFSGYKKTKSGKIKSNK